MQGNKNGDGFERRSSARSAVLHSQGRPVVGSTVFPPEVVVVGPELRGAAAAQPVPAED